MQLYTRYTQKEENYSVTTNRYTYYALITHYDGCQCL